MTRRHFIATTAAAAATSILTAPAAAQTSPRRLRLVSTSGIPHGDVADYTKSPTWRKGMPRGANRAWRTYMSTVISQVTAGNPDVVLHTGDMVEGRWYGGATPHVYGPGDTWDQRVARVHRAADTIYPWMKAFWADAGYPGGRVLWAMGDHEIGDIGGSGVIPPTDFRYRAHRHWNRAWRRHFGNIRHYNLRGNVGVITLDPFVKWQTGVLARIPGGDFDYLRDRAARLRARGARWIVVQCEIPAVGPNRANGTSGLLLENGDSLWQTLADVGVDLLLTAEFHADTTRSNGGQRPVQIVHGGRHERASWLTIDAFDDRLELTLRESVGTAEGSGSIWAPTKHRVNNRPVAGVPRVTGRAVLLGDGSLVDRSGYLTEGI